MRQRRKHSHETAAVPGRPPFITAEDRAEQLHLEYEETPNPERMLYAFEEYPDAWFCPCGSRNKPDESFCGNCGTSLLWLREHTSDRYLAEKILSRKGWEAFPVRKPEEPPVRQEAGGDRVGPLLRIPAEPYAETRLEGLEGGKLRRFLLYMLPYGTNERRLLTIAVILTLFILLAILLIRIAA